MRKVEILGVKLDNITFEEALDEVDKLVQQGRGSSPKYVVKPNPEILVYAQKDDAFRKILNSASLIVPDGVGLLIGSKLIGKGLKGRPGGVELMEAILAFSEKKDYSVYFLGAKESVVEKLNEVVKDRWPRLKITGYHHGYFENDVEVFSAIQKAKPDILFVALGFPKQEKFIFDNLQRLKVPLSIAEGGSFDFLSGNVPRAPRIVRNLGLEWLYRLAIDPKRIRRQMALPKFLWLIISKR